MKARTRGMADFARRAGLNGACLVAGLLLLVVVGLTAWREWSVLALRREVASMEDSLAQRRLQQEREQRRRLAQSPEEREIEALLSRQRAGDRLRPAILRAVEKAWSPRVAMLGLKLEAGGKSARVEMLVASLKEAFAFVQRLNAAQPGFYAVVERHGLRPGDPNQAIVVSIFVEVR